MLQCSEHIRSCYLNSMVVRGIWPDATFSTTHHEIVSHSQNAQVRGLPEKGCPNPERPVAPQVTFLTVAPNT